MPSQSELKKELLEIQSLAKSRFQENIYQRLLVTTITLLITISTLIIIIAYFIRIFFGGETLIGDFLLNLGTDFIGSTIIFIAFSVTIKPYDTSIVSKRKFRIAIISVLSVAAIAFVLTVLNNRNSFITYQPEVNLSNPSFQPYSSQLYYSPEINDCYRSTTDKCGYVIREMEASGLINRHIELYYGQDFINSFLLNISTQFLGSLIIFVGIEQLFRIFERQQENQLAMLKRIDQLSMKIE